jgi:RNA polymerase sigma-70 factor, ECF subfamily
MEIGELKTELAKLHRASFGWALSCCRRNPLEAEDVLQSVYLKILEGKAVYRGDCKLQTWLFAVIRKTAISERRKTLVRALTTIPATKTETQSCEADLELSELQQRFRQALESLPARQREALHLVFYQDLSIREAAEVMGVTIGSARQHYERGKSRLREALNREEFEYGIEWRRRENPGTVS